MVEKIKDVSGKEIDFNELEKLIALIVKYKKKVFDCLLIKLGYNGQFRYEGEWFRKKIIKDIFSSNKASQIKAMLRLLKDSDQQTFHSHYYSLEDYVSNKEKDKAFDDIVKRVRKLSDKQLFKFFKESSFDEDGMGGVKGIRKSLKSANLMVEAYFFDGSWKDIGKSDFKEVENLLSKIENS